MAVCGDSHGVGSNRGEYAGDERRVFGRGHVAYRIRDIDRRGTTRNGGRKDIAQESRVGTTGVLGGELDVVREGPGMGHRAAGGVEHLRSCHSGACMLHVYVRCRDEGVNAPPSGWSNGVGTRVDILRRGASETADDWPVRGSNIGRDGARTASTSPGDAAGNPASMISTPEEREPGVRHVASRWVSWSSQACLFAVAERRVEDTHDVAARSWAEVKRDRE